LEIPADVVFLRVRNAVLYKLIEMKTLPHTYKYLFLILSAATLQGEIAKPWKKHTILATNDAAEGQASRVSTVVAHDFDKNGQLDVISSYDGKVFLYQGPDWKPHLIVEDLPLNPNTRGEMRGCLHSTLMDVDGDGRMDYIGSNRMLFWLQCPPEPFKDKWKLRMISYDVNGAHCVLTEDVDGDGKPEIIANVWRDVGDSNIPNSLTFLRIPEKPLDGELWKPVVFANGNAAGRNKYLGFGDVNKDGRADIAAAAQGVPDKHGSWFAWWEQPENPDNPWKKHILSDKEVGASNIKVSDLNKDGHMDFVGCRVLGKGVIWFKGPEFKRIEIDADIESPHSLAVADMTGNGFPDVICSEASKDGSTVIYMNDGKENFTRMVIDDKQGSYDIRIIDMDGDGDLDILIAGANSRNIVWYENPLR
jgi:hypothetical protein